MKNMTFALCFCNRGFMPGELIYGAREDAESFAAGCVFLAEKFRDLGYSQELSWWNLL